MAMIVYAREGMVLEAEVVRRFPSEGRVHVSLDTSEDATLTTRGMSGRTPTDKTNRLFQLCDERRKETLRVKVLAVSDEGSRKRILVCETKEPLTRDGSMATAPSHLIQRSGRAGNPRTTVSRPAPRAGATWDRQRIA